MYLGAYLEKQVCWVQWRRKKRRDWGGGVYSGEICEHVTLVSV